MMLCIRFFLEIPNEGSVRITMAQIEEIILKIKQGLSDRQIAKAVGRRRTLNAEIRSGEIKLNQLETAVRGKI